MSTTTKLSPEVTQYYNYITSLIGANAGIQRDVQNEQYKKHSWVYKGKTREAHRGPGRIGLQTVCWRSKVLLHLSDQQLRESPSSKLQDLDMRIQRSQNSPSEWWCECQMACQDKYTCIDKTESKSCIKNRVVSISMREQEDIKQVISSRKYSWYDKTRTGD